MTALIWAAYQGHKVIVELFIRQKDICISRKNILEQKHS